MRILVCGSRTFNRKDLIFNTLDRLLYGIPTEDITIIEGGARGADVIGGEYAKERNIYREVYMADWDTHGKRAGYLRNQRMLDEGKPDTVIAFVDKPIEESRGTHMMCRIAKEAGVKVLLYEKTTK